MKRIIIFFVFLLLIATSVFSTQVSARDIYERHEVEFEATLDTSLIIKNNDGDIDVDTWEYDFISLDYVLTIQDVYGKEEFDKVKLQSTEVNDTLIIEIIYLDDPVHVTVDLDVQIPFFVDLNLVETINGNVNVWDLNHEEYSQSTLTVKTTNGDVYLSDVIVDSGDLSVTAETGDLSAYDVIVPSGCFDVDTNEGDVYLHDVSFAVGCLDITTSNGYMYLDNVVVPEGDLSLSTTSGDLSVYDVRILKGSINVVTGNGDISIHDVSINATGLTLENPHGNLYVNHFQVPRGDMKVISKDDGISLYNLEVSYGDLLVSSETGSIYANDVIVNNGNVRLSSTTGDLSTYDLIIPNGTIFVDTMSGSITLHDVSYNTGDLQLNTSGKGTIYLNDLVINQGNLFTSTESGDLSIYDVLIPEGKLSVETSTGDVSIHDVFFAKEDLFIETNEKGSIYLNDVNSSQGNITLKTESGYLSVYDTLVLKGKLTLQTITGEISIHDTVFSDHEFSTTDGDYYISDVVIPMDSLELFTTGDIGVYDVSVPDGSIILETENGDITAHDLVFTDWAFTTVNGDLYVSGFRIPTRDLTLTTTGDISVSEVILDQGSLQLNTETGDLYVGDVDLNNRDLFLETTGDIIVYDAKATLEAFSEKGDISVGNTTYISTLDTEKGSVFAQLINMKEDTLISTGKGSIKLEVNPDLNANVVLDVHAIIGGIFLTNLRPMLTIDSSSFKQVSASIGSGGDLLKVRIGDENNPSLLFGGFITLKKYRVPLFPLLG